MTDQNPRHAEITATALREHRKRSAEERLLMGDRWPARWLSLVFVSENGTPLDSANGRRLMRSLAAEAGIEVVVRAYSENLRTPGVFAHFGGVSCGGG